MEQPTVEITEQRPTIGYLTTQTTAEQPSIEKLLNKITLGDCFDILPVIPDHSVDLILIDPPYYKVVNEDFDRQWKTLKDY
jgi:predicted methyltransferase